MPREEDLKALKAKVLTARNQTVAVTGVRKAASIQGMGGIGKSVLASAIARDSEIQQAFPDGVFWVSLGQTPNLLQLQTELAMDLAKTLETGDPDFSDVQGGKKYLTEVLAERACFLVLDDVWRFEHLNAFDVVMNPSQLLITTRDSSIVNSFGAIEHSLDLLAFKESLSLLANWADVPETEMSREATDIVEECGYLPLAISMVGASLRGKPNRWDNILHKLRTASLEKIRQQLPGYDFDLLRAIQVSIDALESVNHLSPEEVKQRYFDFVVFPEDMPLPEKVLQTFWEPEGLDIYDAQDLIDSLAAKSLLRRDDEETITLHDLQCDYITKQVEDTQKLHQRLLDAYAATCEVGWSSAPPDGYFYRQAARHFVAAGRQDELKRLLLDYGWLAKKLRVVGVNSLIADYDWLPDDPDLKLVQATLRLSAHVLVQEPNQLTERLWGHLRGKTQPAIQTLLNQSAAQKTSCWFSSTQANLPLPDSALLRILTGHTDMVWSVAVTPDGTHAISASNDRTLKVWDLQRGLELSTLTGHSKGICSVVITPDGTRAISASNDCTLKVWDLQRGLELCTLTGHSEGIRSVAVTPDGAYIISGSIDCTLKVWDLQYGMELSTLTGHSEGVKSVAVTPDGAQAISASNDCTLKVWDLQRGLELSTLTGHSDWVEWVAVTPDGAYIISASKDHTLKVWDLQRGLELSTLTGHSDRVWSVAVTPDGTRAISASKDHTLKVWDLQRGLELSTLTGHSAGVWSVAVTPDSTRAISASTDFTVRVWDLQHEVGMGSLIDHSDSVRSVVITPDGAYAISTSQDCSLKVWDLKSRVELNTLIGHSAWVRSVAVTPDGTHAISASDDRTLRVWNLQHRMEIGTLTGHSDSVRSVAVTPDGTRIISASDDGILKVWDLQSRVELSTLTGHSDSIRSVAVTPDGTRIISASEDHTLKIWDLEQGIELSTLTGHSSWVWSAVVTPDGNRIISASSDCTLKVWDLERRVELSTLTGHGDRVRWVAANPDGKCAISASEDNTLKVWDVLTGECLATFCGDSHFYSCAIAPDGVTVVAGDRAGTVHFFRLEAVGGE